MKKVGVSAEEKRLRIINILNRIWRRSRGKTADSGGGAKDRQKGCAV